MDINELESYRLSDAVKFNDSLNPRLWGSDERLLPQVREKLLAIADDFKEFLGVDVEVKDITVSGSNAAYTYTPHSDIDLHLVVDLPKADSSEVYRELFDAKKYAYNDQHDYKIGGYDVELYVQNANQPHVSQGIYSVLNDEWIKVPSRKKPTVDDISVKSKYEDIGHRIDQAIADGDLEVMDKLAEKIRAMRQAGLETTGEFGPENLAFKALRSNGTLERLRDARRAAKDAEMSLTERKKKKKKAKRKSWGAYGGMWFPGYHAYGQNDGTDAVSDAGGDGGGSESRNEDYDPNAEPPGPEFKPEMPAGTVLVNVSDVYDWYKLGQDISDLKHADPKAYGKGAPQTVLSFGSEPIEHMYKKDLDRLGMKTLDIDRKAKNKDPEAEYRMDEEQDTGSQLQKFADYVCKKLKIENCPTIKIRRDPEWSRRNGTFGRYDPNKNTLEISVADRHPADVMRTLAHELVHHHQEEREGIPADGGKTGSRFEDEANAVAGRIMRDFREKHPEIFSGELEEAIQTPVSKDPKHIQQYYDFLQAKARMGRPLSKAEQQFLTSYATVQKMKSQVAEGAISKALLATVFAAATSFVQAQEPEAQPQEPVTAAKILNAARWIYGASQLRAPGVREEFTQEFRNWLRRQGGHTDQPTRLPVPDIHTAGEQPVNEATGYIPVNDKEARDPRYSMAITQDIKPGEVQRQAAKMGFKTDAAGVPPLLMKKLNNLLESVKTDEDCWPGYRQAGMKRKGDRMVPNCVPVEEDAELMEVEMSPSAFRKFLNSPEAEGIRAGFEAELIFRNTQHDPDDDGGESEPDYDADERSGSIDDILGFFQGGDNGISGSTARRLQDRLTEEFYDWVRESFYDEYFDQDRFREWCDDNIWPKVDDDYREDARKYLEDEEDIAEPDDEAIEKTAVRLFHDDVERNWDDQGEWWDEANDELYDEYQGEADESDWLDSQGYRYMSDVANSFDLDWPYWTDGSGSSGGGGGSREWGTIANSLERVTGMPVRVSSGYHGAARRPGQYIIEPDSSLDADGSDDYGLEVVSPPMPLPEAIEQLNRIIDWANSDGDAYTNSSTGIHMGVSLPFKGGDVDPIKLVLFMGDKNILETFGRESNTYARSAYDRIQDKIRYMKDAGPKRIEGVMELMKKNLIELADRELQRGGLGDKYVSVHPQDGYIEFRGPGGDYLSKNDEVDGVLENTMLRLAYAMSIAGRPDLYRKEYAKKLYKVLTAGDKGNPFMQLFSDYSAGTLTGEELKAKWADTVLRMEKGEDEDEDVPMGVAQEYEVYDRDTGEVYKTFNAYNDDEAVVQFRRHYRDQYAQPGRLPVLRKKKAAEKPKAKPSRRAELAKRVTRSTKDVGEQLWRVNHHSSQRWVIARSQAEAVAKAIQQDRMFDNPETRARIATDAERQQWQYDQERERERQRDSERDAKQIRARLGVPQAAGGEFTGQWQVRNATTGEVLHTFGGVGNSQADANRVAQHWVRLSRYDDPVEVVPEMR